jgi:RNA polymerase sigma factor (sigma-70 family)
MKLGDFLNKKTILVASVSESYAQVAFSLPQLLQGQANMANDLSASASGGGFPTTAWSFIRAAQDPEHPEYVRAMNQFIARYWKPIYYFLRVKGHPRHRAEDLTQEFFTRFLERDWLRRADPERGRFRTFLLSVLVRFLSDQGDARAPRQKVFERRFVSVSSLLADEDRTWGPPAGETPEAIFMRQWAATLLADVRGRLRKLCGDRDHADWYDIFEAAHGDGDSTSQQRLAERFHLSRDQVRYALEQVQKWFVVLLRAEVRDQVGSEADVGDEIRELMTLLGR